MEKAEEIKKMTLNIVKSYDEKICACEEIIKKSLTMLDECKNIQKTVQNELREKLARVESLRKKDFDQIMVPLITHQEKREEEIKSTLDTFLKRQRELAHHLTDAIQLGVVSKVYELEKNVRKEIKETENHLVSFQNEQIKINEQLIGLLQKDLTFKEFKKIISFLERELGLVNETYKYSPMANESEVNQYV
jgi:hypothetical protein